MKVLIDATGITRQKTGVGVYAQNLLDKLTRGPAAFEVFILTQDDDPELDFSLRAGVTMVKVPARIFRILPFRMLLEQIYLPFLIAWLDIDVVHSLHYAMPIVSSGAKRIVTFHDMTFFLFPELHQRLKIVYFRTFMRIATHSADAIIFVSESALKDCIERLGQPAAKCLVIAHGKDAAFVPLEPGARIDDLLRKYSIPPRYILYIGTIEPRKNLGRLVEAFAEIAKRDADITLVLAGKMGWMMDGLSQLIDQLGIASRIVFTGFVLEEEKPLLLGACTLFVYPSLYEGFGLPALEALACGAPTVTSNTSSLPEVVGDAAVLIDPCNTAQLSQAMASLLGDSALREDLRIRGPVQARRFTWEACAHATAAAYLELDGVSD